MKTKILKILRNADGFVSGQAICESLGVSRTAVWKVINQLKEEGYEFDAVSNKGYRIVNYPDILTKSEIESQLDKNDIIKKIVFFDETDSTNNRAKKAAEEGEESGTLFITECQTGGRGRRGRNWVSPPGSGIWMTLLIRPDIRPDEASMLTIVAAMAVSSAITKVTKYDAKAILSDEKDILFADNKIEQCKIKWPNDIVLDKKKICGILTEMSAEPEHVNYVVTGIGINVNTTEFADEIKDMASSIFVQTGVRIKRSHVVAQFAHDFTEYFNRFIKTQDLSLLVDDYNKMLINAGKTVRIEERGEAYTAGAYGIDNEGRLIVKVDDTGEEKKIIAGEVSVRGLYGYV